MEPNFVHLNVHSEYSVKDGLIRIEELLEYAIKKDIPALAITDLNNLFAAIKFYKTAFAQGVKPVIGADCWLQNLQNNQQPFRILLLCQNKQGYLNLTRLISRAYVERTSTTEPQINKQWLTDHAEGLMVLSGGIYGEIGQALLANNFDIAEKLAQSWNTLFPNRFYLELHRTGRPQEEVYLRHALQLAQKLHIPLVATNDVRFLRAEDFEAHETRVCIQDGYTLNDPNRPRRYSAQQYLRSAQEMQTIFADIPEALTNSVEIAKRCNLELVLEKTYLPDFVIPGGVSAESYLTQQAQAGLVQRLEKLLNKNTADYEERRKIYEQRLQMELQVINPMGFAGYFLIVADFIHWAKNNGIPVGPGRGSGAGSLVAYALQITDLDPLQYDLLFERFLNPERISMPDFDIDFCMEGRDRVIGYVTQRYGRDAVAQIITYGTMAARGVVRDVGRVLGYAYGMVDKLAKLIPFELGMTLEKALQEEELQRRYQEEDEVRQLFDLAMKLEGLVRNVGKHAAGVVIAPTQLTDFTPLYCEPGDDTRVTQFDMDDIQAAGLVKFDFLGLRTLTLIDWTVKSINNKRKQANESLLDITQVPLDDEKTFQLLKACATTAVFQFESRGYKDLIKRLQPDCFEDLIALGALFRPGPLQSGMVDDFINRKQGKAPVEYPHPTLEPILRPTYGIIVYQEQVLQIAQVLAGYTLGAADILRRAMGKKKPEEMAQQRKIFVEGANKLHKVTPQLAAAIFDLMEKFAGYGFNKSHSTAYALLSYQTAWLKTHYPAEFMAAVLSSDMERTEKVVFLLRECAAMGLQVIPPHINQSYYKFTVDIRGTIIYGLGAIKGVGAAAIENILSARQNGAFQDLFDLCQRVDTRKVNKRVFEALIYSGCLDTLAPNRAALLANFSLLLQTVEQQEQKSLQKQADLFGNASINVKPKWIEQADWSLSQRLQHEKAVLGFYLSGHPMRQYEPELQQLQTIAIAQLHAHIQQVVTIAGWVNNLKIVNTKRGDRMAIVTLEDASGQVDLTLFSDSYMQNKEFLKKDQILIVEGEVTLDDFTGGHRILAKRLFDMLETRKNRARYILLKLEQNKLGTTFMDKLKQTLTPFCPGPCSLMVEYQRQDARVKLNLSDPWKVQPCDELLTALSDLLGANAVQVVY